MVRRPRSVSRPVDSIAVSASRACSGSLSRTRLAAPAWMETTPMPWATMSWSSRAMRSRSAVTACSAACARSASSYARRWCTYVPMRPGQ